MYPERIPVENPLISIRDAVVSYRGNERPSLDGVSLDVEPGSWIAVSGPNGSGKTTVLAVLAGLVPLASGSVSRNGAGGRRPRVAMLMQDPDDQFVASSVGQELALSVAPEADARQDRIADAVERFALGGMMGRSPHRLSGGEKQRLAMATVWLEDPEVLLLDEPLAYLDTEYRVRVTGFVRELNERGASVVWATPGEDIALAERAVVLEAGRVVYHGAPAGAPGVGSMARADQEPPASRAPGAAVLEMRGVRFAYGGEPVLDGVDLRVSAGECVGVFGPNSAGKSTLLLIAGGALEPAAGRVMRADGFALYLPQSPERLFFAETVREEIAFGLVRHGLSAGSIETRAAESLRSSGLDPDSFMDRSPFQLSFGEMRRVAFAIAESLAPPLLLLDEPASCLDAGGRAVLRGLVERRLEAGGAVVVASHDMAHLQGLGSRIVSLTREQPAG